MPCDFFAVVENGILHGNSGNSSPGTLKIVIRCLRQGLACGESLRSSQASSEPLSFPKHVWWLSKSPVHTAVFNVHPPPAPNMRKSPKQNKQKTGTASAPLNILEAAPVGRSWYKGIWPPCPPLSDASSTPSENTEPQYSKGPYQKVHFGSSKLCHKCLPQEERWVGTNTLTAEINCNLPAKLFAGSCKCSNKLPSSKIITSGCFCQDNCCPGGGACWRLPTPPFSLTEPSCRLCYNEGSYCGPETRERLYYRLPQVNIKCFGSLLMGLGNKVFAKSKATCEGPEAAARGCVDLFTRAIRAAIRASFGSVFMKFPLVYCPLWHLTLTACLGLLTGYHEHVILFFFKAFQSS